MGVTIRPMRHEDLPAAEALSGVAFHDHDLSATPRGLPAPEPRSPARVEAWLARNAYLLERDRGGCWVAESESGEVVGMATSLNRELMWILGTYAVRPGLQGQGIGKQLLDAALTHGRDCLRGMLSASSDPKAVRRYRLAGFTLHPQMFLRGRVDRSLLPVVDKVREGTIGDLELMDSIDRRARGAAHGTDHEHLFGLQRLVVSDSTTGSGYAWLDPSGTPSLLAATNRRTAQRLLWEALASSAPGAEVEVHHVTAANEWAIDVGMAARMELHTEGYLALRHLKPPVAYLHHGVFL